MVTEEYSTLNNLTPDGRTLTKNVCKSPRGGEGEKSTSLLEGKIGSLPEETYISHI